MTGAEYSVAIATFALIMILGVEWGILAGIGVYAFFARVLGLDMGGANANTNTALVAETGGSPPQSGHEIRASNAKKTLSPRAITTTSCRENNIRMTELEIDPL